MGINRHDINILLRCAGIKELSVPEIDKLFEIAPRAQLDSALANAKNNPSAKEYLLNTINKISSNSPEIEPNSVLPATQIAQYPCVSSATVSPYLAKGLHVYGANGALYIEEREHPKKSKGSVFHTVYMDVASNIGRQKYLWSSKTVVLLSEDDLPMSLAVCLGLRKNWKGFHRTEATTPKAFVFEHQGAHVFFELQKSPPIRVQIQAGELFYLINLLFRQIIRNQPWLSREDVIQTLKHLPEP